MTTAEIVVLIGDVAAIAAALLPIVMWVSKIANGTKCQLRSEMLRIYYRHIDSKTVRQYEFENFVYLYEAYKALKGNSFVDKIYAEVKTWKIVS